MSDRTSEQSKLFHHPLFFNEAFTKEREIDDIKELASIPFLLDFKFQQKKAGLVVTNELIDHLFRLWRSEKEKIAASFKNRDRHAAKPAMIKGIGWFITILFWINGQRVARLTHLVEDCSSLPDQPFNLKERLIFILENPDHYLAYIQLTELYDELEKKWMMNLRKKEHMDRK
ncbi:YpoC family protein [Pseudalkalibacillus sp. SCS-8]|uniref:YpoC family protein n=1 Tax=Pseudalkalibacillus nanhaiensis TaxID=3115291 RepID=UPI0032DA3DFA